MTKNLSDARRNASTRKSSD